MHTQQRRPGTLTARRPIERPKAKRWSHQDDLDGLKGKPIYLILNSNNEPPQRFDELVEADQFAIKVRTGDSVAVLMKHSFAGFRGA